MSKRVDLIPYDFFDVMLCTGECHCIGFSVVHRSQLHLYLLANVQKMNEYDFGVPLVIFTCRQNT